LCCQRRRRTVEQSPSGGLKITSWKTNRIASTQTCRTNTFYLNKLGGPGVQRRKKHFSRQHIVLVPSSPGRTSAEVERQLHMLLTYADINDLVWRILAKKQLIGVAKRRKIPLHVRLKIPKRKLGRISDINWIPITVKPGKCSVNSSGVFVAKYIIMLNPSKTKMLITQQRWHPWLLERVFQRDFEPRHYHTIGQTRSSFGGGKWNHCSWRLPSCQNTEGWGGCRLWWSPAWNVQNLEVWVHWGFLMYVKWPGVLGGHRKLVNWGAHPHTQKGKQEWMQYLPGHLFP